MSTPLVGITAWRRELDTFLGKELLHTLSDHYASAVINAGMTPLMFPNGQDPATAKRLVGLVDGLVLSGGDDVHPETYGAEPDGSKGHSRDVDTFEVALVQAARQQNKPVLAICRGIQLLNVALGGTLNQEVTRAGTVHEPISQDSDPDTLNRQRHSVHFETGSILAGAYGTTEIKTNSLHHQGIAELSPALIVEGRTDDGLVEAVRCGGDWWAMGVQWHPERMDPAHQQPLFGAFRAAIAG
ncbi:MAG: gamma-glutamyl-gamma-aminobutyrate hydrolase family protein [Acidimicrobiia bacterium]